jgi:hypothetical protein
MGRDWRRTAASATDCKDSVTGHRPADARGAEAESGAAAGRRGRDAGSRREFTG